MKTCMYCGGRVVKVNKGEHIIPKALGGVRPLRTEVCGNCNGFFSDLDKELASASPLAIVAAKELSNQIGLTWDVDRRSGNLLLEAHPLWGSQSMCIWPQVVIEPEGASIRGDFEDVSQFGIDCFCYMFQKRMIDAYNTYKRNIKKPGLFFRRFNSTLDILDHYRYPPRIFVEKHINDFKEGITYSIGYANNQDLRHLMCQLDRWNVIKSFGNLESRPGSALPVVRRNWNQSKILRALLKIGLNILKDTCKSTRVDYNSFKIAVQLILGKWNLDNHYFSNNGFVQPQYMSSIHVPSHHSVRLNYNNRWEIWFSFFGGQVCARVFIDGPNNEKWNNAIISTPLVSHVRDVSGDWKVETSPLILPTKHFQIEREDPCKIVPNFPLINVVSNTHLTN